MKINLTVPLIAILASCSNDGVFMSDSPSEQMMQVILSPNEVSLPDVRSSLSPDLEDWISDATVAAYDSRTGILADAVYSGSSAVLSLITGRDYDIYAIANMGDMTGDLPVDKSGMESLKCQLPQFSELQSQGIPMAGMIGDKTWTSSFTLPLRRMLAKVNVIIDHSDMDYGGSDRGFSNTVLKVYRAARNLYPFEERGSTAKSQDDLYADVADYQVVHDGYADVSDTLTLFIPENMQDDLLEDNTDPWEKSESSGYFDASLCTYISLEGVKDGSVDGVGGDFTYRFFPGMNNTENFDLQGNKVYDISMKLTWDGMYVADNWKVEKRNWRDSRMILVSTSADHGYSSSASLAIESGATDIPVYIYYSPHGMGYESEEDGGEAHHYEKGWNFILQKSPSDGSAVAEPLPNDSEFTGTYMSTGFVRHDRYRTVHYISIPTDTPAEYTNRIIYRTADSRKSAWLDITVTEPIVNSPGLGIGPEENAGGGSIIY